MLWESLNHKFYRLMLHSLLALGGMRGGQPISPNAYSGWIRNLASSVLRIEARPTSQPGITSPVEWYAVSANNTVHWSSNEQVWPDLEQLLVGRILESQPQ